MAKLTEIPRQRPKWVEPPAYDPLPVLVIYLLVIAGGIVAVLDTYLPTTRTSSVIAQVTEFGSRQPTRGGPHPMVYWSSIHLANNKRIWTQRTANNFAIGDSMDVDLSAVLRKVVQYRGHRPGYTAWYATEGVKEKYRPFPFAAILFALLLFYSGWSASSRMLLRGLLFVIVAAWLITLIATRG